ncbi:hypothetical protein [Propioniferax innocua]|uniref:Uncharacterized protein n=1 Tax=Propioniferax innocua TaxID=1753 RepID=A0A542ZC52_9ACTN|nr:hypothetical protein [Propioniferax innocua]TQL57859.1 hypothetical protein FB460_1704 [Propioniferax innocua]
MFLPVLLLPLAPTPAPPPPNPEDVVAGWTGLAVVLVLILLGAALCYLLLRQLRRVNSMNLPSKHDPEPPADDPESIQDSQPKS